MAYSAVTIAQWFVNRAIQDVEACGGEYMTHLKLQKMLYYAQGTHGAMRDKKLFEEDIINWAHGPVVEEVYQEYKKYKDGGIDKKTVGLIFDVETNAILKEVYHVFGRYSAWGLREMTHSEEPWKKTSRNELIPYEVIAEYFKREIITA